MTTISKSNFKFLKDLAKNNNRPWFEENKDRYLEAHENAIAFADSVLSQLRKHDDIATSSGKKALYRIYRDVRFAKDKSPYKTYWGGSFSRATKKLRGGYYFQLEPGKTFVAGGFFMPNSKDLNHIRKHIAQDDGSLRKVLASKRFRDGFGELVGEQVRTAPKGFSKDHPAIDLLRYKQFIARRSFSDKEVLSDTFPKEVVGTYRKLRPFFDYMSEILTTDLNGRSLLR